jgi:hypothetical protein
VTLKYSNPKFDAVAYLLRGNISQLNIFFNYDHSPVARSFTKLSELRASAYQELAYASMIIHGMLTSVLPSVNAS